MTYTPKEIASQLEFMRAELIYLIAVMRRAKTHETHWEVWQYTNAALNDLERAIEHVEEQQS